jgi:folate-binding protein YgfZ
MISPEHDRALREQAGYLRREKRGLLRLRGTDRLAYLHGLLTNDIAGLRAGTGCYAALLTAQGRMITDMRVRELGDMVLIDLDRVVTPTIREHLDRFVITEDVIVEEVTDVFAQVSVHGPASARILAAPLKDHASSGETVPAAELLGAMTPHESRRWDFDGTALHAIASDEIGAAGFDLIVPAEKGQALERALEDAGVARVTEDAIDVHRIEAGIPRFLVDMDTTTIPLEAGIEGRAISMTKGCYVGQEVIVRVLHRGGGRVAKKLVGLRLSAPVHRDDRLLSGDREVGRITSAVTSLRHGPIALGYVQRDFTEPGTSVIVKRGATDVTATVTPVPFTAEGNRNGRW